MKLINSIINTGLILITIISFISATENEFIFEHIGSSTGGKCYLSCHGENHNPCGYDRVAGTVCGACQRGGPGPGGGSSCP